MLGGEKAIWKAVWKQNTYVNFCGPTVKDEVNPLCRLVPTGKSGTLQGLIFFFFAMVYFLSLASSECTVWV